MPKDTLVKIEVVDPNTGGRVTITFEGVVPTSISQPIGEYLSSLLSPTSTEVGHSRSVRRIARVGSDRVEASPSTFSRVKAFVVEHFRYGSFTSRDVQEEFERAFGEKLRNSTISTYMSRLSEAVNGIIERNQGAGRYEYRLRSERLKDKVVELEQTDSVKSSLK